MAARGRQPPVRYASLGALVADTHRPLLVLLADFNYGAEDYDAEGNEEPKVPPEGSETMPYIDESPTMSPQLSARGQESRDGVSPTPTDSLGTGVGGHVTVLLEPGGSLPSIGVTLVLCPVGPGVPGAGMVRSPGSPNSPLDHLAQPTVLLRLFWLERRGTEQPGCSFASISSPAPWFGGEQHGLRPGGSGQGECPASVG